MVSQKKKQMGAQKVTAKNTAGFLSSLHVPGTVLSAFSQWCTSSIIFTSENTYMAIGISSIISLVTSEDTDMGDQATWPVSGVAYLLNL